MPLVPRMARMLLVPLLLRTVAATAIATAAAVLLVWLTPAAAHAAPGLVSVDPADGAALATAPAAVLLRFSTAPDLALSHVSARDAAGHEVSTGAPAPVGDAGLRLSVSLAAAGDYTVAYHVVFRDGRDTVGAVRFSVGSGVAPAQPAGGWPAAEAPHAGHEHGVDGVSAVLLVADLLVAIVVPLLLLRKPRRRARAGRA